MKPVLIWGLGWSGTIAQQIAFQLEDEGLSRRNKRKDEVGGKQCRLREEHVQRAHASSEESQEVHADWSAELEVSTECAQVPKASERSLDSPCRSCSAIRRKKLEKIWKHCT